MAVEAKSLEAAEIVIKAFRTCSLGGSGTCSCAKRLGAVGWRWGYDSDIFRIIKLQIFAVFDGYFSVDVFHVGFQCIFFDIQKRRDRVSGVTLSQIADDYQLPVCKTELFQIVDKFLHFFWKRMMKNEPAVF